MGLISVVIPNFNKESTLVDTLESVLHQSYQNWECIIVDDRSTDGSIDIIETFVKKDPRFFYISRPKGLSKGASSCRNIGIAEARGEFFQFLDSDDILSPTKLEAQFGKLKNKSELILATCKWGRFKHREKIKQGFKKAYMCYRDFSSGYELIKSFGTYSEFFPISVYFTPRKLIEMAGFFNESLSNNDDGEFFVRVLLNARGVTFVEEAEFYYREANSNKLSALNSKARFTSAIESWRMIESNILLQTGEQDSNYVGNAKEYLYHKLIKFDKSIIKEYKDFFKEQTRKNSFINRLKKKLF